MPRSAVILITGAAGNLGSPLARHLLTSGHELRLMYHRTPLHADLLAAPDAVFRVPLSRNARASRAWDALIPSRKKEILRYFSWLKSSDARERNVARALDVLSGKKGPFMARSW